MTDTESLDAIELVAKLKKFAVETVTALPDHQECVRVNLSLYDPEFGVVCGGCGATTGIMHPQYRPTMDPGETVGEPTRPAAVMATDKMVTSTGDIASRVHPADPIMTELVLIDPEQPYDTAMVEKHILDVNNRLERGSNFQRVCIEQWEEAVLAYELQFARALLESEKKGGAADVRKARALLMCEELYVTKHVAKMKCNAIETTMHTLRSVLSGYQSVSSSIRAAYGASGRQSL